MTARDQKGRYKAKKIKAAKLPPHTQRCRGCGVLITQNRSIQDHEMFCEKVQEMNELTPIRSIDDIRTGKLRGGNMYDRSH